jgi:hypothetical protein
MRVFQQNSPVLALLFIRTDEVIKLNQICASPGVNGLIDVACHQKSHLWVSFQNAFDYLHLGWIGVLELIHNQ